MNDGSKRLIIGITGASGAIYGIRLLEALRKTDIETHLLISKAGGMAIAYETDMKPKEVRKLACVYHPVADIAASISSGSYPTMGMIIVPCSIRTMSEIATGVTSTLMSRAADVVLKERRRLVLAVRESPFHSGHLRNMTHLSDIGAIIAPLAPAFYLRPKTIDDLVNHSVAQLLALMQIPNEARESWTGATGRLRQVELAEG
jgi:flavin prenyltransferase